LKLTLSNTTEIEIGKVELDDLIETQKEIGGLLLVSRTANYLRLDGLQDAPRSGRKPIDVHIITDNYSTIKHEKAKKWFSRHKRFYIHVTPTSAS